MQAVSNRTPAIFYLNDTTTQACGTAAPNNMIQFSVLGLPPPQADSPFGFLPPLAACASPPALEPGWPLRSVHPPSAFSTTPDGRYHAPLHWADLQLKEAPAPRSECADKGECVSDDNTTPKINDDAIERRLAGDGANVVGVLECHDAGERDVGA